jgi:hypothetical protein
MDETLSVRCSQSLQHASPQPGHQIRRETAARKTLTQILANQPFRGEEGLELWGQPMGDVMDDGRMIQLVQDFDFPRKSFGGLALEGGHDLQGHAAAAHPILRAKERARDSTANQRFDRETIAEALLAIRRGDRLLLRLEKRVLAHVGGFPLPRPARGGPAP